jgi:tripartite ATP-independent transporter DctP family solute receptor
MRPARAALALAAALALPFASRGAAAPAGAAPLAAPLVLLRLAELHPADHPTAKADYEFARLVSERSAGRIRVAVYTDSVLGQEVEVLEQLKFGAIDIARVSLAAVSTYAPALEALQLPYLYRDEDHMWAVLKGPVGKELLASVSEAGFVGLGWFEAGARSFYDSKRPLRSPADIAGLRIRVQEGGVMDDFVAALGASPVALAFGESYAAILRGSVDGAENNITTYYTSRHYQIAPFYALTEHVRIPEIVVGSASSFAELDPADRALIAKAALDCIDFQRAEWKSYEAMAARKLREAGVSIAPVPDLEPWRERAGAVYALLSPKVRSLVDRIRSEGR